MSPSIRSRPLAIALIATLAAGCASSSGTIRSDPVVEPGRRREPPPPALTMATGWSADVTVERRDSVLLTLPSGERQVQRYGRHIRFRVDVAPDGKATVRLDSLVFRPAAGSAGAEAKDVVWQGSILPGGFDHPVPSRRNRVTNELGTMVRELFPLVPRSGVRPGDQWVDSVTASRQVEIFESEDHRIGEWTALDRVTRRGSPAMPIRGREEYEQVGHGEQAGRNMTMTAQGVRRSTYYIGLDGRLLEAVHSDSASRLITIPASRQAVPTTQFITTEIRFRIRD